MKRLRMAVIGAGRLGSFHAQKLAANDDVELVAVVDPAPESRNRVAAECNTRAEAECGRLLDRIDAAVVAAPTQLHHRLGMELIGRGIHVLMEKPLSAVLAEANELVDAARRQGVVLQVGHVERFNPALSAALPYVPNPKYIEAVRAGPFTFRGTDTGVVMDLMIHDLDLVLSMVRSPVRKVEAIGLSVLGGHEDVANARLHFESGCVATINASRVSRQPTRRMHVWSARAFAEIDFATRLTTLVEPSETLVQRRFHVENLSPEQVEHYKEHLFDDHLPRRELQSEPVDALNLEQEDFVAAIRTPRQPRVSGEHARDAVALAEQILAKIHAHAWDDTSDGPVGPLALPRPSVIPSPHWHLAPAASPLVRKEAG